MADIVVRGMNAPESCAKCQVNCDMFLSGYLNGFAEGAYKRHPACPILTLPDEHGDLVDRNALMKSFIKATQEFRDGYTFENILEKAPAIVPSEKEEENA